MLYFRYLYASNSLSKSKKSNKIELPTIVIYRHLLIIAIIFVSQRSLMTYTKFHSRKGSYFLQSIYIVIYFHLLYSNTSNFLSLPIVELLGRTLFD